MNCFCLFEKKKNPNDASITSAVYNYDGSEIVASYSENDIFLFDSSLAEFSTTAKNKDIGDAKYCYKGHRNAETSIEKVQLSIGFETKYSFFSANS